MNQNAAIKEAKQIEEHGFKQADIMSVKRVKQGRLPQFGYILKKHKSIVFFGPYSVMDGFTRNYYEKVNGLEALCVEFKPREEQPEIDMSKFYGNLQYDSFLSMCLDGWIID